MLMDIYKSVIEGKNKITSRCGCGKSKYLSKEKVEESMIILDPSAATEILYQKIDNINTP